MECGKVYNNKTMIVTHAVMVFVDLLLLIYTTPTQLANAQYSLS